MGKQGGYWAPKYELVPKVTVDQKKRRQAKKSKYEFVYEFFLDPKNWKYEIVVKYEFVYMFWTYSPSKYELVH